MEALLKRFAVGWLAIGVTLAVSGATESPPELQIRSEGPAQVALGWPAPAEDFLLEETRVLSPLSRWVPVAQAPIVIDGLCTVEMPCTEPIRFFRLRYEPSALRSPQSAISFSLVAPGGTNAVVGQPFSIELRASFNAVLAAAAVRISASGSAEAMLTGRSANPGQLNGLMFVSSTSQEPFETGLPVSLTGEGSLEVLLGGGEWPFDGALSGDDVLLERLEVTPTTDGDLTISLALAEAVTSRWAQDGMFFDWVGINPWSSAMTMTVGGTAVRAGNSIRALTTAQASRQQGQPAQEIDPNADGEGDVDFADLVYVRARLGLDPALPENAGADVNGDTKIDLLDLVAVRNRFTPPYGPDDPPEGRLNEVCANPGGSEAPWVELKSLRLVDSYFYTLELWNGSQEVFLPPYGEPIPAWLPFILIVFDGEQPMEYLEGPEGPTGVKLHLDNPGTAFDPAGDECLLYLDGELVDSVVWGKVPEGKAALNTELYSIPSGGSIGRDGYEQDRWVRFGQPTPGAENGLPTPLAYFPPDGTGLLKEETTRFAWVDPRYAPVAYELEVDHADDFTDPLLHASCQSAKYDLTPGLTAGQYFWRVRAMAGALTSAWSPALSVEVLELPPPSQSRREAPQGASTLASSGFVHYFTWRLSSGIDFSTPHKDSSMICLECDQDRGEHAWDKPHTSYAICPHEIGHAGTAIAVDMCEYYRDMRSPTLSQDELNFDIFHTPTGEPEGQLGHGQVVDLGKALEVALAPKLVLSYYFNPHQDPGAWDNVKQTIDRQIPFVGQLTLKTGVATGPVLLIGYYDDLLDPKMRRLVALSPFSGGSKFIFSINDLPATAPIVYVPADPPNPGSLPDGGAPEVDADTDGDGLNDFDEEMRFPTERTKPDSDGDGILDKTEVWSYKFGKGWVSRTADPDGDDLRAEIDPDSDGDGCPDGAEDRNRNGTLFDVSYIYTSSGIVALKAKESDETDSFSEDEYKGTFSAEKTVLHFKESTRLEVKLTDKEDRPVKDADVELQMDPAIGSFDASGGTPVTTAIIQTDADGKASSDFCAQETEGTVTLTATYKPCPNSKEIKAELKIQILPYDWIFAVQEKAVLTGPAMTSAYEVSIFWYDPRWYSGVGSQYHYQHRGFQKVSGYFFHPDTQTPGLYIDEVKAQLGLLRIDGTDVGGSTWTRMSTNDSPQRWEIAVASAGLEEFPRYLEVRTRGGPARRTPLVWWSMCQVCAQRYSEYVGAHSRLLEWNRYSHSYSFFFDDGDENAVDPGSMWPPETTWPKQEHTAVSFIPVAGVPGYDLGIWVETGYPPSDWPQHSGGVHQRVGNFYSSNNTVQWWPPSPWTVSEVTPPYDMRKALEDAGPLQPADLLDTIRFKRDYIGNELQELQQRKLNAPQYEIRMLPEE